MKSTSYALLLAASVLVSGCAQFAFSGFGPGTSASDIQAKNGEPAERVSEANGDSVWYYPSGKIGRQTYAVRVGNDGRVRDVEQRLTEQNVQKIVADKTTIKEVRELMGPPSQVAYFPWKKYTSWEYPMMPGRPSDWRMLWVNFTEDGIVREVQYMRDPEADYISPDGGWQ
jgi:hypothetical protein